MMQQTNSAVQEGVPLAPFTTFQIGGPARFFVEVRDEAGVRTALEWAREKSVKHYVLAGGSNVLIPDEGLNGLVIHLAGGAHVFEGEELAAGAGCDLFALIRAASAQGLGGWEKLAGIPGTLGGAVRGNAGAFGPEIKDFVVHVRALHSETLECREIRSPDMEFSYRHSFFKDDPEWIILQVRLRLAPVPKDESEALIEQTVAEREKRHLQNVRAAGSFFMNPVAPREVQEMFEREKDAPAREGRVPAGWLIEKAGLKGAREGDAIASEQHPNYLKNDGRASARDVRALARRIQDAVQAQFGVLLKEEAAVLE